MGCAMYALVEKQDIKEHINIIIIIIIIIIS